MGGNVSDTFMGTGRGIRGDAEPPGDAVTPAGPADGPPVASRPRAQPHVRRAVTAPRRPASSERPPPPKKKTLHGGDISSEPTTDPQRSIAPGGGAIPYAAGGYQCDGWRRVRNFQLFFLLRLRICICILIHRLVKLTPKCQKQGGKQSRPAGSGDRHWSGGSPP